MRSKIHIVKMSTEIKNNRNKQLRFIGIMDKNMSKLMGFTID